jgi:hypothetical protein
VISPKPLASLLGKLCLLALLGLCAIVLAGPVIVLLVFAGLGLLVYLPIHMLYRGKDPAIRALRNFAVRTRWALYGMTCWALSQVNRGIRSAGARSRQNPTVLAPGELSGSFGRHSVGAQLRPDPLSSPPVGRRVRGFKLLFLGRTIFETLSGSAVGAILAGGLFTYMGKLDGEREEAIMIGAVVGGLLGLVLGVSRKVPASQTSLKNV